MLQPEHGAPHALAGKLISMLRRLASHSSALLWRWPQQDQSSRAKEAGFAGLRLDQAFVPERGGAFSCSRR